MTCQSCCNSVSAVLSKELQAGEAYDLVLFYSSLFFATNVSNKIYLCKHIYIMKKGTCNKMKTMLKLAKTQ